MKTPGKSATRKSRRVHPVALGLARIMAGATILNFGLVLFDLTYIPFRDFYWTHLRGVTTVYDIVKGIEPNRDTDEYLKTLNAFEVRLNKAVPANSPPAQQQEKVAAFLQGAESQTQLQALRDQSIAMVNENPFQLADKSGTLEKIKNRMRDELQLESAKDSFTKFWSADYLQQQGLQSRLDWFNDDITPLVSTNYFRAISESGGFVSRFWLIDIWFVGLFGLDILVRTFIIRRRRPGISLIDAFLWRWYDWLLLIPFWRFLRILPVTLRTHQVGWINLSHIESQVTGYLAENLLDDLSEMILVRAFNIAQSTVRAGNVQKFLSSQTEAVEINDVNEIQVITERLMTVIIMKVLPTVQPELESVLRHSVEQGLKQLPVYKDLQFLPGINLLPNQVTKQLVHQVTNVTSQTLEETLKDEKGQTLAADLAETVVRTLQTELQDPALLAELQQLLGDLLEEWKLTLLQSFESQDVEETAAAVAQIRHEQNLSLANSSIEVLNPKKSIPSDSSKMR